MSSNSVNHDTGCDKSKQIEIKSIYASRCEKDAHLERELQAARQMDAEDSMSPFRQRFHLPKDKSGRETVFLCGNSLGPQAKTVKSIVEEELNVWAECAVDGHFAHPHGHNWVNLECRALEGMKNIVGAADESEVCVTSGLTGNLHNMLISFYRPTPERFKIITEGNSFPSDYYVLQSQIELHGFKPEEALIEVMPRDERTGVIQMEDIIETIRKHGKETAVVMISGVQYLSGQVFDMKRITEEAHQQGCIVGFDLAHAVGNIPLKLHDWNVDFAVLCTYKYLNAGPGSVGGLFLHKKHHGHLTETGETRKILAGWWGVPVDKRFMMKHEFEPFEGARAYQQSNSSVLSFAGLLGSLDVFKDTSLEAIREKSFNLTQYFRKLFAEKQIKHIIIATPSAKEQSGAQISLAFETRDQTTRAFEKLSQLGIVGDRREPAIIRLTFTGLYNSFEEVVLAVEALKLIDESLN